MHVLLVSQQFPPDTALGGIGTQAAAKAIGLRGLGHDVTVVSVGDVPGHHRRDDGVVVHRLPSPALSANTTRAAWLAWSAAVAEAVQRIAAESHVDLVEVPEYAAEGFVLAMNTPSWADPPVVVHVHGTTDMLSQHLGWPQPGSDDHRVGRLLEDEAMRAASLVYASSAFSASWVSDEVGLPVESIPVWHCGVDTALFATSTPVDPPTVAFVGRVTASKGVATLLEAMTLVRRDVPDAVTRLIGRVDEDGAALLVAHDQDALDVRGPLDRQQLPAALAGASVFAAPSRFEAGPGLVYLEAMACGLPVVATDVGGVGEVVIDGVTGQLVAPEDVAALAGSIVELLTDPDHRDELARSARQWVVANADTDLLMPSLEAIYRQVIR